MSRAASKILIEDEPNTFAQALRELAGRRHAKPKQLPRRYTARRSEGGASVAIEGASDFLDAAMIFAASAAAPLGASHLKICVTDCETGNSEHYCLDF